MTQTSYLSLSRCVPCNASRKAPWYLVLAPALGEMVLVEDNDVDRSKGVLRDAMVSKVKLAVLTGKADRRCKASGVDEMNTMFEIRSPLLAGKQPKNRDSCMANLPPFWALLRCAAPDSLHNMELDNVVFKHSGFEVIGTKYPKAAKGLGFSEDIQIARNIQEIAPGDILCLPFSAP